MQGVAAGAMQARSNQDASRQRPRASSLLAPGPRHCGTKERPGPTQCEFENAQKRHNVCGSCCQGAL